MRSPARFGRHHRTPARTLLGILALALVVAGGVTLGIAASSQHHAPQPSRSAAGTVGRRTGSNPPTQPGTSAPASSTTLPPVLVASPPVSIAIPAIGVRSALLHLGLQPDGALQVPQPGPHYDEAAWCRCSPTPGERGPSVILGHVDSAAHGPSVFFRLGALRPGDTIAVTRADGTTAVFRTDGVRRFPKGRFPTQLVYGNTPDAQLRLLTCGGAFDRASGHYRDNIVVFATLISDHPLSENPATPTSGVAGATPEEGTSTTIDAGFMTR